MPKEQWSELALHPVRIRILRAVAGGRRTARELAGQLPDVPQATLYRHLRALTGGGVLDVVEKHKVGGATERVYALPAEGAELSAEDLATATREDHGRYFTAFVSSLLAEFSRYLDRDQIDPVADGVGYHEVVLHLDDEEFARFATDLAALVRPLLDNEPRERRVARLLATIVMPADRPDTGGAVRADPT